MKPLAGVGLHQDPVHVPGAFDASHDGLVHLHLHLSGGRRAVGEIVVVGVLLLRSRRRRGRSRWRVNMHPARTPAGPILVDGPDPVGVGCLRSYAVVGVGGRRRAGVLHQRGELTLRVVVAVATQDHVARDAVVLRVVPSEYHQVVGRRGREAGGLGGERRWRRVRPHPVGELALAVLVDGPDLVHVLLVGFDRFVGVGRFLGTGVTLDGREGFLGGGFPCRGAG